MTLCCCWPLFLPCFCFHFCCPSCSRCRCWRLEPWIQSVWCWCWKNTSRWNACCFCWRAWRGSLMDVWDGRSQTWIKAERGRGIRWFWWWSDTARPRPNDSIALCCFVALCHKGQKACFLVQRDLVLCDMAGFSSAIIIIIAFDHPSCAIFHLCGFVPEWPVERELLAESVLPCLTCLNHEILVLRWV